MQWRIKPVLPVSKLIAAVAVAVLAFAFAGRDPVRWVLAAVLVLALLLWALRDVLRPVRLAADAEGVTVVTGFLGRRRVGWAQIERVRVDRRSHRGLRSEYLELDAGDAIYLFSANDLGELPEDVATALADLRLSPA
ncbi:PH domain-containing protein [Paractinoplanes lichenicola]|uniref:PH domain-containing protein n=1 Tax=Paractinoplanes lichenicola TaxID=2802976 RepID=A0ABS1W462_9ACTN|nr:PH domain-containing protein [Actinoplanes lichenicola]MBL7261509.1 PH domain-containing protein [Actinoplanes lichenicola]